MTAFNMTSCQIRRLTRCLLASSIAIGTAGPPAFAQEQTVEINGFTLHYLEQGSGEPVVFVHGRLGNLANWNSMVPGIADEFQTITYTQRYYGAEPWEDAGEKFTSGDHAADLVAFIQDLNRGPVHVVTWSYGGEVALVAAVDHPELFLSMVHYEPAPLQLLTDEEGQAAVQAYNEALAPAHEAARAGDLDQGAELFLDTVFQTPGLVDSFAPEVRAAVVAEARTLTLEPGMAPLTCEMLGTIETPTRVLLGADTNVPFFRLAAETVAECIPNAELVEIPGLHHAGPIFGPDVVNAEVVEFLEAN